jgi:hypothetical protein
LIDVVARRGSAWRGKALHGLAGLGGARQGEVHVKEGEGETKLLFDVGLAVPLPSPAVVVEEKRPPPPDPTVPFDFEPVAGARISEDGQYRYVLWRRLKPKGKTVLFIGLNPSTADAEADDPTVRAMMSFARRWNCGLLIIGNLMAYRATDPKKLRGVTDPVGPENAMHLLKMHAMADICVAAWGNGGSFGGLGRSVYEVLAQPVFCLGINKTGHPLHPLYCPRSRELSPFAYGETPL